jgi:tripeptide aminopeptidase
MDTVDGTAGLEPLVEHGRVRSKGRTVLGADDKAGLAAILEAVRARHEAGDAHANLELIFTVQEERGLVGARRFDVARLRSRYCFTFDSSQPVGHFVVQQPSQAKLYVTVHGRRSHAGTAPERGVNAIVAAARALAAMPLGRIDHETTANVGIIRGGQSTNIVPDRVEVHLEARSHSDEKLERQVQAMLDAFERASTAMGARVEARRELSYRAYRLAESAEVVQRALAAARACGFEAALHASGGGSDANVFNEKGLPTVVAGLDYREIHSPNEWIPIASLNAATRLAEALSRIE